jgi:hypothetical protein
MLRWGGRGNGDQAAGGRDEWAFLRNQPDWDADEMASVRGSEAPAAAAAVTAGGPPQGESAPAPAPPSSGPAATRPLNAGRRPDDAAQGPLELEVRVGAREFSYPLQGEVLIGRRDDLRGILPEVDVSDDDAVSRRHAEVRVSRGRCWLRDLNSLNGTRHNGSYVSPERDVLLKPGDEITIGEKTLLRVVEVAVEEPEPLPEAAPRQEDPVLAGILAEIDQAWPEEQAGPADLPTIETGAPYEAAPVNGKAPARTSPPASAAEPASGDPMPNGAPVAAPPRAWDWRSPAEVTGAGPGPRAAAGAPAGFDVLDLALESGAAAGLLPDAPPPTEDEGSGPETETR